MLFDMARLVNQIFFGASQRKKTKMFCSKEKMVSIKPVVQDIAHIMHMDHGPNLQRFKTMDMSLRRLKRHQTPVVPAWIMYQPARLRS